MKFKLKNKIKFKIRILQLFVFIITVLLTKVTVYHAFLQRGYKAIGGEYLILFLGFFAVIVIEDSYRKYERRKQKNEKYKNKRKQ